MASAGRRRRMAATAALAVILATPSGSTLADTLREAFVSTYLTNPRLEAGRARLRQADELVPQALSGYRPQLFLDGGVEAARGEVGTVRPGTRDGIFIGEPSGDGDQTVKRTTKQIGVTLQQNLYAGGGTRAGVDQAENQVQAERARLVALEQEVLLDAVDAYTATWRDQAVLELALNNAQRLRRQLEATRDRFRYGEIAQTDVAQAEARLARARADVESARADLAASKALYERVIGEEPQTLAEPVPVSSKELPKTLADALAIAQSNPQIVAATFELYAARDEVDVARATLLPSVDLQAQAAYVNQPQFSTPWQRTAAVGVNVTVPLYQGGGEYARIRQNRQRVREQQDTLQNAYRVVEEIVTASWERLQATSAAIEAFRAEVRANELALEGVQQEALVGARTVLDVLDAEQELFTSKVNLVRARREQVLASYQLKAALGGLTAAGIELNVTPYDPDAYYRGTRNRLFGVAR